VRTPGEPFQEELVEIATRKQKADFFARFEEAAQNNIEAAIMLEEFCRDFTGAEEKVARLHDLEHKGDEIAHGVYEALNRIFMPPLDREDIIAIATALDEVMDHIHETADAMCIYNIKAPTSVACSLAVVILACTRQVALQLPKLRNRSAMRGLEQGVIEIHRLENEADSLLRKGIRELFHDPHDPVEVIAWSRIYETMERITDECEDIADVLRGLVIKHA
jgi:predicted phosphate transport protein (TIGR00153 family)